MTEIEVSREMEGTFLVIVLNVNEFPERHLFFSGWAVPIQLSSKLKPLKSQGVSLFQPLEDFFIPEQTHGGGEVASFVGCH